MEEEEDMGETVETRAVVITDNKAVMLEIVSTSLASEDLVQYTKDRHVLTYLKYQHSLFLPCCCI